MVPHKVEFHTIKKCPCRPDTYRETRTDNSQLQRLILNGEIVCPSERCDHNDVVTFAFTIVNSSFAVFISPQLRHFNHASDTRKVPLGSA